MKTIEAGHGKHDVSCGHGSRWIWWPGEDNKGAWMNVVRHSQCDCSDPPRPDKSPVIRAEYFDASKYHKITEYV